MVNHPEGNTLRIFITDKEVRDDHLITLHLRNLIADVVKNFKLL